MYEKTRHYGKQALNCMIDNELHYRWKYFGKKREKWCDFSLEVEYQENKERGWLSF